MGSERRERESECAEASGVGVRKWGGVTHKSCFGAIFVPNFTTAIAVTLAYADIQCPQGHTIML